MKRIHKVVMSVAGLALLCGIAIAGDLKHRPAITGSFVGPDLYYTNRLGSCGLAALDVWGTFNPGTNSFFYLRENPESVERMIASTSATNTASYVDGLGSRDLQELAVIHANVPSSATATNYYRLGTIERR